MYPSIASFAIVCQILAEGCNSFEKQAYSAFICLGLDQYGSDSDEDDVGGSQEQPTGNQREVAVSNII